MGQFPPMKDKQASVGLETGIVELWRGTREKTSHADLSDNRNQTHDQLSENTSTSNYNKASKQ